MAGVLIELLNSIPELAQKFTSIATGSPEQAVLVLVGTLVMAFTMGVFGYLVLGAVLSPIGGLPTPGRGPRTE